MLSDGVVCGLQLVFLGGFLSGVVWGTGAVVTSLLVWFSEGGGPHQGCPFLFVIFCSMFASLLPGDNAVLVGMTFTHTLGAVYRRTTGPLWSERRNLKTLKRQNRNVLAAKRPSGSLVVARLSVFFVLHSVILVVNGLVDASPRDAKKYL